MLAAGRAMAKQVFLQLLLPVRPRRPPEDIVTLAGDKAHSSRKIAARRTDGSRFRVAECLLEFERQPLIESANCPGVLDFSVVHHSVAHSLLSTCNLPNSVTTVNPLH